MILIEDDGDETCYIKFDGEIVGVVDHERYGWDGMRATLDFVERIALAAGIEFVNNQDIV